MDGGDDRTALGRYLTIPLKIVKMWNFMLRMFNHTQ